ncbi:MAG TPA: hypothetical protein VH595_02425 [Verrucomicrobiae bacterium]|jgi:hypothetical protein|nr:hypothetical protein [Verrucomicrobiae bacterium]
MTTLNQAERLVRKIGELVGQPIPDVQASRLAQEYAELCRGAGRRLEQCALMIEAAQGLQALQLAETPPPLLDLITVLSFREAGQWRTYCQAHNLPWAEAFYDKYIRLLNSTYGKGIAADHPFYRDYRRAVLTDDDDRALSILRVIARLNPADENTKAELKRLEEKLVRVKVETLTGALETGDVTGATAQVAKLESSGLPVPSSHPVWQRLQVARCGELLSRAEALRERGAWGEAEVLVEEIHALATQNNLQLPAADADLWNSLEEWTTSQRRAYAEDQDFKRAVSALEYEIQAVETFRNRNAGMKPPEIQAAFDSLTAKWRDAEHFGRPLDSELSDRGEQCMAWLQNRLAAAERKQRIMLALVALIIVAAIGASIPMVLNWQSRRNYLAALGGLESARRVADTETLEQRIPAKLKTNAKMAAGLARADKFISRETKLKETFDRKFDALQKAPPTLEQTSERRADCEKAIAVLAPEFQDGARSEVAEWDRKWKMERNGEFASRLAHADEFAGGLNVTNGFDAVRKSLSQVQDALSGLDVLVAQPPPMDRALDSKYHDLAARAAYWSVAVQDWEKTETSLEEADGLEDYFHALAHWAQLPFATDAQRDAASEIGRLKINEAALLGELLLPNDKEFWGSLTNPASWRPTFMPGQPTDAEKAAYLKLRDDKNMQSVYAYELTTNARPGNPFQSHPVFAQGLITPDRAGQESGLVYDPTERRGPVQFTPQTYSDWDYVRVTRLFRTQECDAYEQLGLGELIDTTSGNYQKPILQLFDQLNQDDNSSALFRAFVTIKLDELARMRPLDWGLQWAPDATRDIRQLRDLGADRIQSGDWMSREQVLKFEKPLQRHFLEARKVSLADEARFMSRLVRQVCEQGFLFGGFAGSNGTPVLHETGVRGAEYWGWDARSGSATLLFRRAANGENIEKLGEPMPYTPLLVFSGDRRKILLDAQQEMSQSAAATAPALPPFFSGL